jgi:L-amino acid N-acyltransferase YncA
MRSASCSATPSGCATSAGYGSRSTPRTSAVRAYKACGFVEEGRLREQAWLDGRFVDMVYMGVLREEWRQGAYGPD